MNAHVQPLPSQFAFDFVAKPTELASAVAASIPAPSVATPSAAEIKNRIKQAGKLRTAGQALIDKAESFKTNPAQANTARRARMAASAAQSNESSRQLGVTMVNVAHAIESGEASHLCGVTTRAAIETLIKEINAAQSRAPRGDSETDLSVIIAKYAAITRPEWGKSGSCIEAALYAAEGHAKYDEFSAKIQGQTVIDMATADLMTQIFDEAKIDSLMGWWNIERIASVRRLARVGITTDQQLKAALLEFIAYRETTRKVDPVQEAILAIVGRTVGIDFFPTPQSLAERMARMARIKAGMLVLEPSAGTGTLADAAKAAGAMVHVIEIGSELQNILTLKGHTLVGTDFDEYDSAQEYDAILMNPPFLNRTDARHIQKAYSHLKSGGHLVAIASESLFFNRDKCALAFCEWLDEVSAEVEQLPGGTFNDPSLIVRTGASTRLIHIVKP